MQGIFLYTLAIHLNKIYQNKNKDTNKKSKYGGNSLRRRGLLFKIKMLKRACLKEMPKQY